MSFAAKAERIDRHVSVKTLGLSCTLLGTIAAAALIWGGVTGQVVETHVEKILPMPTTDTVAVKSSNLNDLDLKAAPPPVDAKATTAGGAQQMKIEPYVEGLVEKTDFGNVPFVREQDRLTAFKAYAAPFTADPSAKGLISVAFTDFGLSEKISRPMITDFPSGVSFITGPYLKNAQQWVNSARGYAREVWLSIPVQTRAYPAVDTGPNTILSQIGDGENNNRLLKSLATATGYAGVAIDSLDAFSEHKDTAQKIMTSIATRGLGILQTDPKDALTLHFIGDAPAPAGVSSFNLDTPLSEKEIEQKLIEIEAAAIEKKKIIVMARPYPVTIKTFQKWFEDARNRGIQFAPISATLAP